MKKIITFSLALIAATTGIKAQSAKDIFSANEMVWYGLDFTKAKFVGQFDQGFGALPASGMDMRNKWIRQWNDLIAKEPQNFKLRESFRKDNVFYDMNSLNELNTKIDVDKCMSFNTGTISKSEIEAMVKKYTGEKKQGIGLAFIVENFNKGTEMADVYVTFFDIATKKVLLCEKESGKAVGVGMRNYWAGSIKTILKQIANNDYASWKSNN